MCEKRRVGESSDDADVATDEEALMALFDASLASKVELAKRVFALDSDSDELNPVARGSDCSICGRYYCRAP